MRSLTICTVLLRLLIAPVAAQPLADHHQHLFSPYVAALISPALPREPVRPITAEDLIRHLDEAQIRRAVVFSTAYMVASPTRKVEKEREKVAAENDWTAQQVAQFPDRLIGFCSLNPLSEYALDELARCARNPYLRRGLKLHVGSSRIDYHNAAHIARLREVFRAASDRRMAIVIHMRTGDGTIRYGRDESLIFLREVLPAAPDVAVQIAHMAGESGNEQAVGHQALSVFVDAIGRGDPRTRQLWFDVTQVVNSRTTPERASVIVKRIRQLGIHRVLYGSDEARPNNLPRENWAEFRALPLTDAEFDIIVKNVPPYLR